ncbi:MAG: hypothetical protein KJP02_03890 [Octadecabacter sp.]|nr:hypothetical protein [Octadecabacter sp.]
MVARAKVLGLITGAAVAGVVLIAVNAWRHVSDDDRLSEVLADHCLPYVRTGATPFEDVGRAPGVYDAVDLREGIEAGGAVLLYDARFVAQWGILRSAGNPTIRLCDVKPTYAANTVAGFAVNPDGFIERYSAVIASKGDLAPEMDTLTDGPHTLAWVDAGGRSDRGLRVVLVASPGLVSSALAVNDLPD